MGQLGACRGYMAPGPCRPGDLLAFTSRHAHLALQKALKFSPLGTKHATFREDLKSFSLIDSCILSQTHSPSVWGGADFSKGRGIPKPAHTVASEL